MAAILIPNFVRAKGQGQLTACKSNQKNIGTAMEMYSTDYKGLYPTSMGKLTPNYLRTLPECPAAGKDTYSNSLKVTTQPDTFSFYCEGHHHAGSGVPADKPAYSSQEGLIER